VFSVKVFLDASICVNLLAIVHKAIKMEDGLFMKLVKRGIWLDADCTEKYSHEFGVDGCIASTCFPCERVVVWGFLVIVLIVFLTNRKDYEPFICWMVFKWGFWGWWFWEWGILRIMVFETWDLRWRFLAAGAFYQPRITLIARNFFVLRVAYFVCRCLRFVGHSAHSLFD